MTSPLQTSDSKNNLKQNSQSSDVQGNPPKVPRSDVMELDREETHQQRISSIEKVESLAGRISPQEEVSHPYPNPDAESLLEKRREETSNTAVKGGCLNPSPEQTDGSKKYFLKHNSQSSDVQENSLKEPNVPRSEVMELETEETCRPRTPNWKYLDILFNPFRRGNGCSVNSDCSSVCNYNEMGDCPDKNRKAGSWGNKKLFVKLWSPSQYWYLSIHVFSEGQDALFPGTLCEVGVGTEYALHVLQPVSESAKTRYIKSTLSFNYATIQRLAQANRANNSPLANEQRPPLRVDLGFYWNTERRRVHILHLAQNSFTLLYKDDVRDTMDVWPVVSVVPFSECKTKVEIKILHAEECPFAPIIDSQDLLAIVDAP